jgi:hypothetical protein
MRGDDDSRPGKAFGMGNPPRLTEESGVDPWLVDLVRSTGAYKSPPGRKQRVLLSLGRSNARGAPFVLRPVIVVGVLIGCGAFASAAIGPWRGWIGRAYERLAPTVAPVALSAEPARGHRSVAGHAAAVAAQSRAVATPAAESPWPEVAPPDAPAASRAPIAPPHLRHEAPAAAAREEASRQAKHEEARREEARREAARDRETEDQETQSVLAGMRALRVDHDPVRARGLLARYLERHPNGALAEEALALTIEAAMAHRDGDAPALGVRYLRRYPGGPFRELAFRAQR